ncbi:hypothetical protein E4T49_01158 [Aureobasidium sp. EXF-10728]|nr:hypothetical protein E4T49_01158 [Aureobasidium sp. EXF-10728]
MTTQKLRIPSVTEEDLRLFHNKHFSSLISGSSNRHYDTQVQVEETIDDDNLGYYPDGVKRTLTNAQIAIFRHSEIQLLLRERRRNRESNQAEGEKTIPSASSSKSALPVGDISPPDPAQDTGIQHPANTSGPQGTGKRKWQRFIETSEANPSSMTHRRLARELDEQKASSIDLAYGDDEEESTPQAVEKQPEAAFSTQGLRKQVAYDYTTESVRVQPPSQGSHTPKFLWPTLDANNSS